jgi:polyphosphate kinase
MSQLDSELNMLRIRLAALEEQKRIELETASEKKAFPLKTLEGILDEKRKKIERNSYSKSVPLARFYDQEKLAFLEPIFNMLKN